MRDGAAGTLGSPPVQQEAETLGQVGSSPINGCLRTCLLAGSLRLPPSSWVAGAAYVPLSQVWTESHRLLDSGAALVPVSAVLGPDQRPRHAEGPVHPQVLGCSLHTCRAPWRGRAAPGPTVGGEGQPASGWKRLGSQTAKTQTVNASSFKGHTANTAVTQATELYKQKVR